MGRKAKGKEASAVKVTARQNGTEWDEKDATQGLLRGSDRWGEEESEGVCGGFGS